MIVLGSDGELFIKGKYMTLVLDFVECPCSRHSLVLKPLYSGQFPRETALHEEIAGHSPQLLSLTPVETDPYSEKRL